MTRYLAAALLTTALFTCTALAQTTSNKTAADRAASQSAASHREGEWRASKLIGVNVYNDANEKIGDINDVILDKAGKVENVIPGALVAFSAWVNTMSLSLTTEAGNGRTGRRGRPLRGTGDVHHTNRRGDKRPDSNARTAADGYRSHDGRSDDNVGRSEGQWLLVSRPRHLQRDQGPVEGDAAVQILKPNPAASVNLSGRQTN